MKLTKAIQESLLCLLCFDSEPDGAKFVRGYVPPECFDPFYKDIATASIEFLDQYGIPPGDQTLELVDSLCARDATKEEVLRRLYSSMLETNVGIVKPYVLDQASKFVRFQTTRKGIAAAIERLEEDDVDGASHALREIEKTRIEVFDPGIFLTDTTRGFAVYDEENDAFPTGIRELDKRGLGPARKRLHLFMAPPKSGKSWWLLHVAKVAMVSGKRVLYITMELSQEEVVGRFYQSLFSMTKREGEIVTQRFKKEADGKTVRLEEKSLNKLVTIRPNDPQWRSELRAKIKNTLGRKPKLLVKEFPSGTLTIEQLRAYLSGLEGVGFIPDLICVDYADLFKISKENVRTDTGRIYVDLRGIGQERSCAIATASQINRTGAGKKMRTERDVSEDFSKVFTADTVVTYNQTQAERFLGLARLFLAAGRTDEDKFAVHISQAYGIGQFALDSTRFVPGYWDEVSDKAGDFDGDQQD